MTEYLIIVALIAIGTTGAVGFFGDHVRALANASADAVHGNEQVDLALTPKGGRHKTLKTFGTYNAGAGSDTGPMFSLSP